MNARVKLPLSKADKETVDRVLEQVREQVRTEQNRAIARAFKTAYIVLHQEFGFGKSRLRRFDTFIHEYGHQAAEIPERWNYIDKVLKELGFEFEEENISERETHTRELYHEKGRKFREY